MDLIAVLRQHLPQLPTVTIRPYQGRDGNNRPVYGAAVEYPCVWDETRRYVRDALGAEVISESTVITVVDAVCPDGSEVFPPGGRKSTAIKTKRYRDHGQAELPAHAEIALE